MISHRVQKRLTHEVHEALALRDKRGQSKHKDKQAARKAAQDNHTAYKTITGLYATTSLTTYARQAKTALCWIAERYGCRNLAECKEHLPAYYADMIARNLSAWTIRTRVYALCAVYAQPYQELFGVESLPIRHRADITRGRTLSASNDRYHAEHHEDARLLARACGARRGGLRGLTADGLRTDTEGNLRVHLREKGGKERDALVLPDYMPISALKAYQIERIYADMREPDAKRTYCVTATELDKIRKEKGMTYKVLAEKAGLCIDTVQIACKGCRVSLESVDKMAKVLQCAVDKAFKLEVRKSPYSSTTINGVHRFLRAVCHYAEKHKLLTDNPIDAVRAPKIDAEIYVFSEEESARFIRAVMREKDIRVKTALLILIYLGLRKGELCGLTWGSVDLGKGIVHVAQQLKEKSGEGLILGKLKTKESKADLPLSPMLAEVLAEYRQWWNEHKAMYGDAWRGEWECLFVGDDGTPLNPSTINEWLDKLTERNGLPHVTVHSLRHLCATLLIRTHADPKTVQTILRHANVSTTLNIYAKVFDSTQMEAIGRVQASLENMLKESCSSSAQV